MCCSDKANVFRYEGLAETEKLKTREALQPLQSELADIEDQVYWLNIPFKILLYMFHVRSPRSYRRSHLSSPLSRKMKIACNRC
jgi:hypothetical protein